MLYQLSYTRISAGKRDSGHGFTPGILRLFLPTALLRRAHPTYPLTPIPCFPAAMVGVGFEPT
jgi:hypothetical protein